MRSGFTHKLCGVLLVYVEPFTVTPCSEISQSLCIDAQRIIATHPRRPRPLTSLAPSSHERRPDCLVKVKCVCGIRFQSMHHLRRPLSATRPRRINSWNLLCEHEPTVPAHTIHSLYILYAHIYACRPDMTFAVDWALSNNYLSIIYACDLFGK